MYTHDADATSRYVDARVQNYHKVQISEAPHYLRHDNALPVDISASCSRDLLPSSRNLLLLSYWHANVEGSFLVYLKSIRWLSGFNAIVQPTVESRPPRPTVLTLSRATSHSTRPSSSLDDWFHQRPNFFEFPFRENAWAVSIGAEILAFGCEFYRHVPRANSNTYGLHGEKQPAGRESCDGQILEDGLSKVQIEQSVSQPWDNSPAFSWSFFIEASLLVHLTEEGPASCPAHTDYTV